MYVVEPPFPSMYVRPVQDMLQPGVLPSASMVMRAARRQTHQSARTNSSDHWQQHNHRERTHRHSSWHRLSH